MINGFIRTLKRKKLLKLFSSRLEPDLSLDITDAVHMDVYHSVHDAPTAHAHQLLCKIYILGDVGIV